VVNQFQEITSIVNNFPDEIKAAVFNLTNQTRIVDLIADSINLSFKEKVAILSLEKLEDRLQALTVLLNREEEIVQLSSKIQMNVHEEMGKNQRDFFLREQLRQIQHELGEDGNPDVASIKKRMENIVFPPAVKEILDKELERLDLIPQASGEYNIAYTYIDWLVSVPWSSFTEDRIDVKKAEEILNADHYGLKDVKERILEFLAVLQLRKSRK